MLRVHPHVVDLHHARRFGDVLGDVAEGTPALAPRSVSSASPGNWCEISSCAAITPRMLRRGPCQQRIAMQQRQPARLRAPGWPPRADTAPPPWPSSPTQRKFCARLARTVSGRQPQHKNPRRPERLHARTVLMPRFNPNAAIRTRQFQPARVSLCVAWKLSVSRSRTASHVRRMPCSRPVV